MASRSGNRWVRHAAAAVVALAGIAAGVLASGVGDATSGGTKLSAAPLGVNVGPWDGMYTRHAGVGAIQPLLRAAGVDQLRYGGGSFADYYDWQTNTDIGNCLPGNATASFASGCAAGDPLGFGEFSQQARAIGAQSFVTVNYGSGTPALASAWVAKAKRTPGEAVALWEVGNENYGCWEVNNPLAGPPANVGGYQPQWGNSPGQNCPEITQGPAGTQTIANSYAANALPFLRAMKAADPAARIGVPWAFGEGVSGSEVPNSAAWNDTVLGTDRAYVSFVDAHYYPFSFSGATGVGNNQTDEQVLRRLRTIPSLAASIKAALSAHHVNAAFVIGETAVSNNATNTVCTPVGAVFAAGDVLSWLAAGASSVDWWDLNNYGNTGTTCTNPDFGFFTSSKSTPEPETVYYGYLLASALARPAAQLATLPTSDPADVLAFQSALPDGRHAAAFLNLDTGAAHTVTFQPPAGLSGSMKTATYSAGQQNPYNSEIISGTTQSSTASVGLRLPPESITVLETP